MGKSRPRFPGQHSHPSVDAGLFDSRALEFAEGVGEIFEDPNGPAQVDLLPAVRQGTCPCRYLREMVRPLMLAFAQVGVQSREPRAAERKHVSDLAGRADSRNP
jgi:hypothetical protein